jgi:hypothetical protein
MAPRTNTGFLNGKQLAARGWTHAMIRDFLGGPDHVQYISRFRNAAPMLQFAISRVQAAERTRKFVNRLEMAARRSAAAREAWERRRHELLRLVAADEVPIPRLPPDVLADRAVRHSDPRETVDRKKADRSTLNRWKVNYLRHELIRFDATIESLFGQIGRAAAEKLLRRRALETIGKTYPDLLDECQRQLRVSERKRC